jgi:FKBP-type peptidyl-prolyl cis-trans isomerase FkpA
MSKWLLLIIFICCVIAGCTKTQSGVEQYRKQAAIDDTIVARYIRANGLTDVAKKVSDTSGVYYIIKSPGQGSNLYTSSTYVTVGDTGRMLDSTRVFYQTNDFHPSYQLGQMILGWRLGIPKVQKGGIVRLLIPSRYAYGPYPQSDYGLPANAILDFDIQVYNITN